MAFAPSDYTDIPTSGIIPDKLLPADEFSWAFTFTYVKEGGDSLGTQIKTDVTIEIRDSGNSLKYTLTGEEQYFIEILPQILFSWNWISNLSVYTAKDANGVDIAPVSQASNGVIPGGGSSGTTDIAIIDATEYSLIYPVSLESGDKIKITFHNISAGFVVDQASLHIATRLGSVAFDIVRDPAIGTEFVFAPQNSQVVCASTPLRQGITMDEQTPVVLNKTPYVLRGFRAGALLYCLIGVDAPTGGGVYVMASVDDGVTWVQAMATPIQDFKAYDVCSTSTDSSTGGWLALGESTVTEVTNDPNAPDIKQGDQLAVFMERDKDGSVTQTTKKLNTAIPKTGLRLEYTNGLYRFLVKGTDTVDWWESTDALTWTQKAAAVSS